MASGGGKKYPSSSIFLASKINDCSVLAASVSDYAPTRRDLSRFTVPFQEKGSESHPKYIQLYNLQVYTIEQLREGQYQITTLESVTVEGQTAITLSCRELNRITGRPIVLIQEQEGMMPQQIDESRLVIKANQRGEELTPEEQTLAISLIRKLLQGLPDCELRPIPPFGSQANPARIQKKLSNSIEVKPRCKCVSPVPVYRGRQPAEGILGGFYKHKMPGWLGCGGNCPSCRHFVLVLDHAVKCCDVQCHYKELLVRGYIEHVQTDCRVDPCYIPFCKDSKHLICLNRGMLWSWVINDVIENIRGTMVS
ncbi:Hypp8840 [Branchiostoma lanceolatum]|uniref:Hypp8840 protein n=1 Tax=Branchiostoma lanceolatum TaxID=7740 RepID=A0A8K0EES1_BRALA|nr:Hypp8840 [Branchiostoma lanceolatum]